MAFHRQPGWYSSTLPPKKGINFTLPSPAGGCAVLCFLCLDSGYLLVNQFHLRIWGGEYLSCVVPILVGTLLGDSELAEPAEVNVRAGAAAGGVNGGTAFSVPYGACGHPAAGFYLLLCGGWNLL